MPRRKAHTLVLLRPFASPPLRWFYLLSCDERPRGSLPAFAWDDVATPIHPITGWRSLCPQSFARIAMGKPCGLLSPRERYGISTFRLRKHVGLGACCRPGGVWVTRAYCEDALPTSIAILAQAQ